MIKKTFALVIQPFDCAYHKGQSAAASYDSILEPNISN